MIKNGLIPVSFGLCELINLKTEALDLFELIYKSQI